MEGGKKTTGRESRGRLGDSVDRTSGRPGRSKLAGSMNHNLFQQVYSEVRQVPAGRVSSYGAIARRLGWVRGARQVGWALRALKDDNSVPWHRIVNSRGEISLPGRVGDLQKALLKSEGVVFDSRGRLDMAKYGW